MFLVMSRAASYLSKTRNLAGEEEVEFSMLESEIPRQFCLLNELFLDWNQTLGSTVVYLLLFDGGGIGFLNL